MKFNLKFNFEKYGLNCSLWGIYSVWHRHARVYQKTWLINSLPPLTEPVIYLLAFGYGLSPLVGEVTYGGQTVSYLRFLVPGMTAIAILFQTFSEGAYGSFIRLSFQKTCQALLTAPLSFGDVFFGEWLWAATKGILAGLLTEILAVSLGLFSPWYLLGSFPLIVLGSLLFGAFGLLTAGSVRTIEQINVPLFLGIVPMFTFCGTYFPRDTLPPILRAIATLLPLSPLVDLLRGNLSWPDYWWALGLWLIFLTVLCAYGAWRKIYPLLVQ